MTTPDDPGAVDLEAVATLYEDNLTRHGVSSPAVGWRDPGAHVLRFDQLLHVVDPADGPVTVNDLGCGYGALHDHLVERGVALAGYRGYDISAGMLDEARRRVPDGEFILGSTIDRDADLGFACGIFNVRLGADEAAWAAHVDRTLDMLDATSRLGFAFNLLSTYVDWRAPDLFYADPLEYFDRCRRRYGRRVALLHDTPLYEWTITVRR